MREHVRTTHEGGKRQNCEICGRSCVSNQALEKHIKAVHRFNEDVTNVQCHKCDQRFARIDQLKKHVSAEHHKTFFHFLSERKKNEETSIIKFDNGAIKSEKMKESSQFQYDHFQQKSTQIDQLKKHVSAKQHHHKTVFSERKSQETTLNFENNRELKSETRKVFSQLQHDHFQDVPEEFFKQSQDVHSQLHKEKKARHPKIISNEKSTKSCGFCKADFESKKDLEFHILACHRKINLQPRVILKRLDPKIISELLIKYAEAETTTSINSKEEDDKIIKIKQEKVTEIQQYQCDHLSLLPQFPTPGLFPSVPQGLLIPPQTPKDFTPEEIQQYQNDYCQMPQTIMELENMEQKFQCDFCCAALFKKKSDLKLHFTEFHDFEISQIPIEYFTPVPEEIQQYQNDHSQMPQKIMELKTMEQQFQCDVTPVPEIIQQSQDVSFQLQNQTTETELYLEQ